tara:strand:+ start:36 stop:710 length:675 start_codon:yes stop_codon:yes gene_type:complete
MKTKLLWLAAVASLLGSAAYGVTILSVAGSNGSQVTGGAILTATLNNIYTDMATLNAALGGSGVITVAAGKTFTVNNTVALTGTDSTTMTFPTTSATLARTDAANTFTGVQTMTSASLTTPVISAPTGIAIDCGATAACPDTARGLRMVQGVGTLVTGSPSTYAVTAISPAFTGTTTYNCFAQDTTTIATNIGVLTAGYVSTSAVTFTGPNTTTDTFRWYCIGY